MNTAQNIHTIELADQLERALQAFKENLNASASPVWLPPSWLASGVTPLEQAAGHLTRIMYLKDQNPRETTTLPGLILVDGALVDEIKRINALKGALEQQVSLLKETYSDAEFRRTKTQIFHRRQWSLKQTYRRFDLFEDEIDRVSISWSISDTIQKKANATNLAQFVNAYFLHESEKIAAKEIIDSYDRNKLVFIRKLPPHLTSSFRNAETKKPKRLKVHSPVFLAGNKGFPKHPDDVSVDPVTKNRAPRSDKKEVVAVFPNLNLYYRP